MKEHWEKIYLKKKDREVSWFQESPETSLALIQKVSTSKNEAIIDVGGGNSNLIGELQKKEYVDLTTLDISGSSIRKMQKKLGSSKDKIHWIESNILDFEPEKTYQIWHDRAAFHFLVNDEDIAKYKSILLETLPSNGYFILATFSTDGPAKCSGLQITQYNKASLKDTFGDSFDLIDCFTQDHETPFDTNQNFIFSVWRKRAVN